MPSASRLLTPLYEILNTPLDKAAHLHTAILLLDSCAMKLHDKIARVTPV